MNMPLRAKLNGCRLRFFEVRYEGYNPPRTTFRATITDRPVGHDLKIEMNSMDDLFLYMDSLFSNYNVKFPLKVLRYDEKFNLIE